MYECGLKSPKEKLWSVDKKNQSLIGPKLQTNKKKIVLCF